VGYHQRKLHQIYYSFIKVDQGHHVPYNYLFGVLYSKECMKQRSMTSTTCKNAWCKLLLTLKGHQCWRDHLRSCVHAGDKHLEHTMLWPECSFVW